MTFLIIYLIGISVFWSMFLAWGQFRYNKFNSFDLKDYLLASGISFMLALLWPIVIIVFLVWCFYIVIEYLFINFK